MSYELVLSERSGVLEARHVRPMLAQDRFAKRFAFTECHCVEPSPFQTETKSTNT